MKVGRFDVVEYDGSFLPDNGVYWNTSNSKLEAWKNKDCFGYSDKDLPNAEDWVGWMLGEIKLA